MIDSVVEENNSKLDANNMSHNKHDAHATIPRKKTNNANENQVSKNDNTTNPVDNPTLLSPHKCNHYLITPHLPDSSEETELSLDEDEVILDPTY